MAATLALIRRELSTYFSSFTGYITISLVLFLVGLSFTDLLLRLNQGEPTDVPVTEMFYQSWYFWLILLLASPVVTMRTFAAEKALGTFETLVTTPISDLQLVLAKFFSSLVFHLVLWLPLILCVGVVRHFANDRSSFDVGMVASTYLGVLLLGCLYMSIGCFASSLTRSQIVASMISFALGMAMFLLGFKSSYAPQKTDRMDGFFSHISMVEHMQDFVRGVVDSRQVFFYLSVTVFFLFLTHKVVESRRWR